MADPVFGIPPEKFYIRATHPSGFRSGQWARVIGVGLYEAKGRGLNPCFIVEFVDGAGDFWSIYDPADPYEFAMKASSG